MSLLVAIILGLVVLVVVVKLALGLVVLIVGLAVAVAAYFIVEKLVGRGE